MPKLSNIEHSFKKIDQDLAVLNNQLTSPIVVARNWKGRFINFGQSITNKYNQIGNLFRTGKWSVEKQAIVIFEKDLKETIKLINQNTPKSDHFYGTNISQKKTALENNQKIRKDFENRLESIHETYTKAASFKTISEADIKLFNRFGKKLIITAVDNQQVIEDEKAALDVLTKRDLWNLHAQGKGIMRNAKKRGEYHEKISMPENPGRIDSKKISFLNKQLENMFETWTEFEPRRKEREEKEREEREEKYIRAASNLNLAERNENPGEIADIIPKTTFLKIEFNLKEKLA